MSEEQDASRVEYRPVTILQMLKDMKNNSKLAVDLGYLSIVFNERELAKRVLELEKEIDKSIYQLWMSTALAVRDGEDAEKLVGIMKVGSAIDEITNAAADMAIIVNRGLTHPSLRKVFQKIEDRYSKVSINGRSTLAGKKIGALSLETKIGVEVLAVKRDRWIINPTDDEILKPRDILLVKGSRSGVPILNKLASGELKEVPRL
jgi:uncharacterized protein with PhoU and TrkA domain